MPSFAPTLVLSLLAAFTPSVFAAPTTLSCRSKLVIDTDLVAQNAISATNQSWEYGALTEALIELQSPALSVFAGKNSIPPPTAKTDIPGAVWNIISNILDAEAPNSTVFIDGAGAAGDPAAVGVAAILINTVSDNETWTEDIEKQLNHLLYDVPHSAEGAISQRESEVQYWADYMYMVPPFLAYYGAVLGGDNATSLLKNAHLQCKLYREALFDADVSLWRHIAGGSWQLNDHWATGNAWAAAGMTRVLATIQASDVADELKSEQQDLIDWTNEILAGSYAFQALNGTLYNDIDQPDTSFVDAAGTALITAAGYRLATITGDVTYLANLELAYSLVADSIDEEGWLYNAVNPLTFDTPLTGDIRSPEGQSFILALVAARNDYWDN
ncbi:hypothetical protein PENSPDRAFT_610622 [Peniophora sp. CONT]|nr:hypothetical protein PENSPDRAFT_610622 [Peniophora sp. CONT]